MSDVDLFATSPIVALPVADIVVPEDRQRAAAVADETLLASITAVGLINPIIVRSNSVLVAGERRLDAFRKLGHALIPARIFEDLPPLAAFLVELQENIARENLRWQEIVSSVARYHDLRVEAFPAWTIQGTANDVGYSLTHTSRLLAVARYLDDEEVADAATLNGAVNLIEARASRALAAAQSRGLLVSDAVNAALPTIIPPDATREEKTALLLAGLSDNLNTAATETSDILERLEAGENAAALLRSAAQIERSSENVDDRILHLDFLQWAPDYKGPRFDVLHCDFPYGKGYKGSNTRRTGRATKAPTYGDGADIYFALVDGLLEHQDQLVLPSAHCIFWFDMMHYCWTVEQFTAAGWRLVQPFPLVWTKSYQGVASDPKRRPRHCYETALLFSRGDRLIRKLDKDHYEEQVDADKLHISAKPVGMLQHFLQLVVDEHSTVLDPTCGSATALVAASRLGATRVLGLEIDESNVDIARYMLEKELP